MNLLHIISGDLWAGAESQVYNTLGALKQNKQIFVVCLLFNNGILRNKLEAIGVTTHVIDETRYNSFEIYIQLRKFVRAINPDIIHVHHIKEHLLGFLSTYGHFKRIPLIRTMHGMHGVRPGLPLLQRLRSTMVVYLDNILTHFCSSAIMAVSRDLRSHLHQQGIKTKIYLIYNSIDVEHYATSGMIKNDIFEAYRPRNIFWIGTAARLVEPKNLEMLVDAAAILRKRGIPFQISIFGDGPLKRKLEERIERHHLEKEVKLHGFVDNVLDIIDAIDVFVLCSIHEGLPMALLEAMFLEVPVICTKVGGMKEVVEHDVNGLMVDSNDFEGLAAALLRLYDNKILRDRLTANAKQTILDRFSTQKSTKALVGVYEKLCSTRFN